MCSKWRISHFGRLTKQRGTQSLQLELTSSVSNDVEQYPFLSNDAELAELCGGPLQPGEALLFHGTSPALVDTILKHGANEAYTNRAYFGKGVYFAENCRCC